MSFLLQLHRRFCAGFRSTLVGILFPSKTHRDLLRRVFEGDRMRGPTPGEPPSTPTPNSEEPYFLYLPNSLRRGARHPVLFVMSPGGGELRYLTDNWQDEAPTWSPNGRIVQFFRTHRGSGKAGIWQVDLSGRNERRLATPVDGSDPAWGPILP